MVNDAAGLLSFIATTSEFVIASVVLTDPAKQPWIITEEGEILSPNWIRTYLN